ncbi:PKHA7 protein, partial [Atractosteus spatula]|nr:PKHA7 protein [Atractosteus spatula]
MSEADRLSQASSVATVSSLPAGSKASVSKVHSFGKRGLSVKRDPNCPVIIRGWLYKQDSSGLKLWKRRWFVLSDYCLFYYRDSREETVLGSIPLPSYSILLCTQKESKNRKFAFKAAHAGMRSYMFSADTQEDMVGWIRAMTQCASLESDPSGATLNSQCVCMNPSLSQCSGNVLECPVSVSVLTPLSLFSSRHQSPCRSRKEGTSTLASVPAVLGSLEVRGRSYSQELEEAPPLPVRSLGSRPLTPRGQLGSRPHTPVGRVDVRPQACSPPPPPSVVCLSVHPSVHSLWVLSSVCLNRPVVFAVIQLVLVENIWARESRDSVLGLGLAEGSRADDLTHTLVQLTLAHTHTAHPHTCTAHTRSHSHTLAHTAHTHTHSYSSHTPLTHSAHTHNHSYSSPTHLYSSHSVTLTHTRSYSSHSHTLAHTAHTHTHSYSSHSAYTHSHTPLTLTITHTATHTLVQLTLAHTHTHSYSSHSHTLAHTAHTYTQLTLSSHSLKLIQLTLPATSDLYQETEHQPIRGPESKADKTSPDPAVLTRLCGCDKLLQSLAIEMAQLRADKDSLQCALEMTRLQLEEWGGQEGVRGPEGVISQQAVLQEELVQTRARICDVATVTTTSEMDKVWGQYEQLESELSVLCSHLEHICRYGRLQCVCINPSLSVSQEQSRAQREIWMIEDILCGLSPNKNNFQLAMGSSRQTGHHRDQELQLPGMTTPSSAVLHRPVLHPGAPVPSGFAAPAPDWLQSGVSMEHHRANQNREAGLGWLDSESESEVGPRKVRMSPEEQQERMRRHLERPANQRRAPVPLPANHGQGQGSPPPREQVLGRDADPLSPQRVTRVVTGLLPCTLVARRVSVEDPPPELPEQLATEAPEPGLGVRGPQPGPSAGAPERKSHQTLGEEPGRQLASRYAGGALQAEPSPTPLRSPPPKEAAQPPPDQEAFRTPNSELQSGGTFERSFGQEETGLRANSADRLCPGTRRSSGAVSPVPTAAAANQNWGRDATSPGRGDSPANREAGSPASNQNPGVGPSANGVAASGSAVNEIHIYEEITYHVFNARSRGSSPGRSPPGGRTREEDSRLPDSAGGQHEEGGTGPFQQRDWSALGAPANQPQPDRETANGSLQHQAGAGQADTAFGGEGGEQAGKELASPDSGFGESASNQSSPFAEGRLTVLRTSL